MSQGINFDDQNLDSILNMKIASEIKKEHSSLESTYVNMNAKITIMKSPLAA